MAYPFETFDQKAKRLGFPSATAMIEDALRRGGNKLQAAQILDVAHSSLNEWLQKNGYDVVVYRHAQLQRIGDEPLVRAS